MPVSDVFFIRGRGTVLTGQIEEGTIRVGDKVQIGDRSLRVDGIEAFRRVLDEAHAGDNVGILFRKLDREDVKRGEMITAGEAAGGWPGAAEASSPGGATSDAPAGGPPGRDPRFAAVESQRLQLLSMRQAGLTTDSQVDEALRGLIFDAGGRQWLLKSDSDRWYSSVDGQDWRSDTPPG